MNNVKRLFKSFPYEAFQPSCQSSQSVSKSVQRLIRHVSVYSPPYLPKCASIRSGIVGIFPPFLLSFKEKSEKLDARVALLDIDTVMNVTEPSKTRLKCKLAQRAGFSCLLSPFSLDADGGRLNRRYRGACNPASSTQ